VQETLELALARARLDGVRVGCRPRLLSDDGPCQLSDELRRSLEGMRSNEEPCRRSACNTRGCRGKHQALRHAAGDHRGR
jgi:hypothetical protein